jgi:hypothetical protein
MDDRFDGRATIAASGSLSDAVIIESGRVVNVAVPTWTDSAAITFQAQAPGGGSWFDVYDELGVEVQIPASTHNRIYSVPALAGMYAVKVRSGTAGAAVNQTNAETITVFGVR